MPRPVLGLQVLPAAPHAPRSQSFTVRYAQPRAPEGSRGTRPMALRGAGFRAFRDGIGEAETAAAILARRPFSRGWNWGSVKPSAAQGFPPRRARILSQSMRQFGVATHDSGNTSSEDDRRLRYFRALIREVKAKSVDNTERTAFEM